MTRLVALWIAQEPLSSLLARWEKTFDPVELLKKKAIGNMCELYNFKVVKNTLT